METIKQGVYREKPRNLQRKLGVRSRLRTEAAEMVRASDIAHYNAQKDIEAIRAAQRIDPITGRYYIP